jgi:hypothetical protein
VVLPQWFINLSACLHRAEKSLTRECGWKDNDRAALESGTHRKKREEKTVLTHTGLLMEGVEATSSESRRLAKYLRF